MVGPRPEREAGHWPKRQSTGGRGSPAPQFEPSPIPRLMTAEPDSIPAPERSTRGSPGPALAAPAISIGFAALFHHRTLLPDEIRPLLATQWPLADQLNFIRADLVQTPAINLLARIWFRLFGATDAAAKSLIALINGAALIAFTALARRVTRSFAIALLVGLLFYLRIGSSLTLVRMYALLLLLIIGAMIAWDQWQRTGSRLAALGFVGAMIGAIYTHASAGLLLPAFVLAGWPTE